MYIMIVVTGAAGFIASGLVGELNKMGIEDVILVDDFSKTEKKNNLEGKRYAHKIEREVFVEWFETNSTKVDFVFHIGARTDTTEFDKNIFDKLNVNYTKDIWTICAKNSIPMIYASSAATYGLGEYGYVDSHDIVKDLKPLNAYGESKNNFDKWALQQENQPPFWAGLKFFNVYGPNEYHKGRMASVIFHSFNQINEKGEVKLFKSHKPEFKDGEQLRDFVYVKDVISVMLWLKDNKPTSGLYNLGTGKAESFLELAKSTFAALNIKENISFIDTPLDIRDKYQYFTEADMGKLINAGYTKKFYTLREGVTDYVQNYLVKENYL